MGYCLPRVGFRKITVIALIIGLFFRLQKPCTNMNKTGLGYVLGDFLTNSSGHPGDKYFSTICSENEGQSILRFIPTHYKPMRCVLHTYVRLRQVFTYKLDPHIAGKLQIRRDFLLHWGQCYNHYVGDCCQFSTKMAFYWKRMFWSIFGKSINKNIAVIWVKNRPFSALFSCENI
jgi:hypothetical protein